MRMYPTDRRGRRLGTVLPVLCLLVTLGLAPTPTVAAGTSSATITLGSPAYAPGSVSLADGALTKTVAVGFRHTCSLTRDGGVQCWGDNTYGQLGRGTVGGSSYKPQWVSGLRSGVAQIAAGEDHTCVTKTDGSARCWGWGSVGNGRTADANSLPVTPTGLGSGVRQMSAGGLVTCALRTSGAVLCWGSNEVGGVGDGTTTDRLTPTRVNGLPTDIRSISAGMSYACALTGAGRVWCWGGSQFLGGPGSYFPVTSPVLNTKLTSVTALDARLDRTCAVTATGATSCWGGPASLTWRLSAASASPTGVEGLGAGSTAAVAAGYSSVCVLTQAAAVKCVGASDVAYGEALFGQTQVLSRWAPLTVTGLDSNVVQLANNYHHRCAVRTTGALLCWGRDAEGQLGNPRRPAIFPDDPLASAPSTGAEALAPTTLAQEETVRSLTRAAAPAKGWRSHNAYPQKVGTAASASTGSSRTSLTERTAGTDALVAPAPLPAVAQISAGGSNACARTTTGTVWCWGSGTYGVLGVPVDDQTGWPGELRGLRDVTAIAVGDRLACAVTKGQVWCWGDNLNHQIAPDDTMSYATPTRITAVTESVRQVAVGAGHVCVLTTSGGVWCWGTNWYGELGNGTRASSSRPVRPVGLGSGVTSISADTASTCAVLSGGSVRCWGWTTSESPGNLSPVTVPLPAAATKVVSGGPSCAVLVSGAAWCWGENRFGSLGAGTLGTDTRPRQVSGLASGVRDLDTGGSTGCATIASSGQMRCWGAILGNAHTYGSSMPLTAAGVGDAVDQVALAHSFGCLRTVTGQVWCWGDDYENTLGRGEDLSRIPFSPTPVRAGRPPV